MPETEWALAAVRALHLAALLTALGLHAFRLFAFAPLQRSPQGFGLDRIARRAVAASLLLALAAGALWFALQGAAMLGRLPARSTELSALLGTRFGGTLALRLLLLAAALALLARPEGRAGRWASLALLAAAAFLQLGIGHGAAADRPVALALGLHVVAAGFWLGALAGLVLACLVLPSEAPALARRFTPIGLACVAALLASSLLQVEGLVGTLPALFGTPYGRLVLAKLALFLALLILAAANSLVLVPRARRDGGTGALRLSIGLETGLAVATVAVAAVLAQTPPGLHEPPLWPFPYRPVPELWEDAYLRALLLRLLGPVLAALALAGLAIAVRRLRWPALAGAALSLALVEVPPWRPFVLDAVPTSFQRSPTAYAANAIALGRRLFSRDCASCHAEDARGRGPAAAALSVWPPDLTAPLIAGRPPGELLWSIRHGTFDRSGTRTMPGFAALAESEIWSLIDFIRLRAGARAFDPPAGTWMGAVAVPGFLARCPDGTLLSPRLGSVMRLILRIEAEGAEPEITASVAATDPARETACRVDDPAPLAWALSEIARMPAGFPRDTQFLIDARGWLRKVAPLTGEAERDAQAETVATIAAEPLSDRSVHH